MGALHFMALLAFSTQAFAADYEWMNASFSGGKFNVSWKYDKAREMLMFRIEAQTVGYVALGFTKTNSGMKDMDVVVGGKKNDKDYIHDLWSSGLTRPPNDTEANYNLTKAEEASGITKLMFERKVNTGDVKDLQFAANDPVYLAFAYHNTDDAMDVTTFPKHDERGYSDKQYDLLLQTTPSPTGPGSSVTIVTTPRMTQAPTSGQERAAMSLLNVALPALFLAIFL